MNHGFNIEVAEKYGITEAVLIENLAFWQRKNQENGNNYHDGHYWSYNTRKAFNGLFPYMSEHQIYRALKKLEDAGIIKTGNYNKNAYDRTKWYTIIDHTILQLYKLHFAESRNGLCNTNNGLCESAQPIPFITTDVNTNIKTDTTEPDTTVYECEYFTVDQKQHNAFIEAYPGIDHIQEYKKAYSWCVSNPSKTKSRKNFHKFLNNWLTKAVEYQSNTGTVNKVDLSQHSMTPEQKAKYDRLQREDEELKRQQGR